MEKQHLLSYAAVKTLGWLYFVLALSKQSSGHRKQRTNWIPELRINCRIATNVARLHPIVPGAGSNLKSYHFKWMGIGLSQPVLSLTSRKLKQAMLVSLFHPVVKCHPRSKKISSFAKEATMVKCPKCQKQLRWTKLFFFGFGWGPIAGLSRRNASCPTCHVSLEPENMNLLALISFILAFLPVWFGLAVWKAAGHSWESYRSWCAILWLWIALFIQELLRVFFLRIHIKLPEDKPLNL
jgi:hypothetical protein